MAVGVRSVIERSLVENPLWSLDVVCLAFRKRHFIYIVSVYQVEIAYLLILGVNLRWTGVPSKGESMTLILLVPWKPEINAGPMCLHDTEKI